MEKKFYETPRMTTTFVVPTRTLCGSYQSSSIDNYTVDEYDFGSYFE